MPQPRAIADSESFRPACGPWLGANAACPGAWRCSEHPDRLWTVRDEQQNRRQRQPELKRCDFQSVGSSFTDVWCCVTCVHASCRSSSDSLNLYFFLKIVSFFNPETIALRLTACWWRCDKFMTGKESARATGHYAEGIRRGEISYPCFLKSKIHLNESDTAVLVGATYSGTTVLARRAFPSTKAFQGQVSQAAIVKRMKIT